MSYDAARRRRVPDTPVPVTAQVTVAQDGIIRVVPLDDDERHPLEARGAAGVGGVAVGDLVLVVITDDAAWIAGKD